MSVQVKHRRDTAANISSFTPAQGELIVDTTNNRVIVGDGATLGGFAAAKLSEVSAPSRRAVANVATTITSSDRMVCYTSLTAARVVTLCAASAFPVGSVLRIVDETGNCSATNTITINRAGSDTIVGATSFQLNGAYTSVAMESDGVSKWTFLNNETVDTWNYAGFGTAPDPSNVISAYGASALFNGTNFSFTVNKSASANVASVIFEDGFSLRAQIGLLNTDNFQIKVSPDGSTYYSGVTFDNATGAPTLGNARTAVSDAAYTVLATDREVAYTAITAPRVVTLPAASAYPAGHALVIIDESGAVSTTNTLTINRAGADTISGKTSATLMSAYAYCRLFSNGSSGWVMVGRSINVQTFSASGTYTPTPGMTSCTVFMNGGGGGGGGGALQAASTACSGGGGGGGGGTNNASFTAAQIGSSRAISIGAGGTGGVAASTSSTAGGAGSAGGLTVFGSLIKANGGGGGAGGQLAANSGGGGGGGPQTIGAVGSGSSGGAGGLFGGSGGSGAAGTTITGAFGASGGGGGVNGAAGSVGGDCASASSGGRSGGGVSVGNAVFAGAAGGAAAVGNYYVIAAAGAAGASGTAGTTPFSGMGFAGNGGGGGGSATSGTAGAGGAGGGLGGGGGGGASAQNGGVAGAGGAGGAGSVTIVEYF